MRSKALRIRRAAQRESVRLRRTPRGAEPPRRGTSRGGDAPRHRRWMRRCFMYNYFREVLRMSERQCALYLSRILI